MNKESLIDLLLRLAKRAETEEMKSEMALLIKQLQSTKSGLESGIKQLRERYSDKLGANNEFDEGSIEQIVMAEFGWKFTQPEPKSIGQKADKEPSDD